MIFLDIATGKQRYAAYASVSSMSSPTMPYLPVKCPSHSFMFLLLQPKARMPGVCCQYSQNLGFATCCVQIHLHFASSQIFEFVNRLIQGRQHFQIKALFGHASACISTGKIAIRTPRAVEVLSLGDIEHLPVDGEQDA